MNRNVGGRPDGRKASITTPKVGSRDSSKVERPLIFAAFFSSCNAIPQVSTGCHLHARSCGVSKGDLVTEAIEQVQRG